LKELEKLKTRECEKLTSAKNLATLRRIGINLLKQEKSCIIIFDYATKEISNKQLARNQNAVRVKAFLFLS